MPTINYDSQSLIIDGRRVWLVSGSIHYIRSPHQLWRKRIQAAKQAGLNCIDTYVFWNAHEREPGQFNFDGDLNIRQFVQTVAEEGMFCIIRPGPYVCSEWDFGGLPAWLLRNKDIKVRQDHPAFLEACERYLRAVMNQLRDLQVSIPVPGKIRKHPNMNVPGNAAGGFVPGCTGGGPIILIQAENEWFCHNPQQAEHYLKPIVRFLKENGCEVPIINCNGLYQRVEGTIDTWNANWMLDSDLRQLATIQHDAPRIVSEFWPGWFDKWNQKHECRIDDEEMIYRMAQIAANGAQFNLYMFHGGTNFAFWGGRSLATPACFMTTSYEFDSPLLEAGGRDRKYLATKRFCTFISQFHQIFANLKPQQQHTTTALCSIAHPTSVFHLKGNQGDLVFIIKSKQDKTRHIELLLPDGLRLPVNLSDDRVAWLLLDVNLGGIAKLNYTNLRPWALINKNMLVLFGPAGSQGILAINGAQFHCKVPVGKKPLVAQHGPIKLVVMNKQQIDATYLCETGIAVGTAGLDDQQQPVALRGYTDVILLSSSGDAKKHKAIIAQKTAAPVLSQWQYHDLADMTIGRHESFRKIDGPIGLEELLCDYGYGWYKLELNKQYNGRIFAPLSGDRLHLYQEGKFQKLIGLAPAAQYTPVEMTLNKTFVILADNLGRYNVGQNIGERKGLIEHFYLVKPIKLASPGISEETSPDPFQITSFVLRKRVGEKQPAQAITWKIKPEKNRPVIIDITDFPADAVLCINGKPVAIYSPLETSGLLRYVLDPRTGDCCAGINEIKLALYKPLDRKIKLKRYINIYQATDVVTENCNWYFSQWSTPQNNCFTDLANTRIALNIPTWFRCRFNVKSTSTPLWLHPHGMSKGQIFLNGRNVGRYFVATHTGKTVPPQKHYYLPEPWLLTGQDNELLIFDEHGKNPSRCRLLYNPLGPYH